MFGTNAGKTSYITTNTQRLLRTDQDDSNEARTRERSDRGRFLPLGQKASS